MGPRKQKLWYAIGFTFTAHSGRLSSRQPAHIGAAPKCHTPSPWLAVRPSAASVGFCAVASHRARIPQPRLAPSLLGVLVIAGYSGRIASSVTTNTQVGTCL